MGKKRSKQSGKSLTRRVTVTGVFSALRFPLASRDHAFPPVLEFPYIHKLIYWAVASLVRVALAQQAREEFFKDAF
jgi:hypothetical protein